MCFPRIFIVMPFIEHDLKTLLADMPHPFLQSEVKTLILQLLSAVTHCHANWIVSICPSLLPKSTLLHSTFTIAQATADGPSCTVTSKPPTS